METAGFTALEAAGAEGTGRANEFRRVPVPASHRDPEEQGMQPDPLKYKTGIRKPGGGGERVSWI